MERGPFSLALTDLSLLVRKEVKHYLIQSRAIPFSVKIELTL